LFDCYWQYSLTEVDKKFELKLSKLQICLYYKIKSKENQFRRKKVKNGAYLITSQKSKVFCIFYDKKVKNINIDYNRFFPTLYKMNFEVKLSGKGFKLKMSRFMYVYFKEKQGVNQIYKDIPASTKLLVVLVLSNSPWLPRYLKNIQNEITKHIPVGNTCGYCFY